MLKNGENLITDPQEIANHTVSFFSNIFCHAIVDLDTSRFEEVIPKFLRD